MSRTGSLAVEPGPTPGWLLWVCSAGDHLACRPIRWEVIANYMNLHSTTGIKRTAKDVINKAKNLQRLGETTWAVVLQ